MGLIGHFAQAAQDRKRKAPEESEGKVWRRVLPRTASAVRPKEAEPHQRSAPFRRLSGLGWQKGSRTAQRPVGGQRVEDPRPKCAQPTDLSTLFHPSPTGGRKAGEERVAPVAQAAQGRKRKGSGRVPTRHGRLVRVLLARRSAGALTPKNNAFTTCKRNGLVLFVARSSPRPRLTRMRGTATPRGKGIRVCCCSNPKALTPSAAYP